MKIKSQIDLKLTQESGQTSQSPWKLIEDRNCQYCQVILIDKNPILIKASQKNINSINIDYEFLGCSVVDEDRIKKEVIRIFDLDFDLEKFYKFLSKDPKLKDSIDFCKGLRLFLARDPFESIIASISSANNSILRWTKSIDTISKKWGNSYKFKEKTFNTFPSPNILKNVYEDEIAESEGFDNKEIENCKNNLKSCGVGYRAPYILKTANIFTNKIITNSISKMTYQEAFNTVLELPGVGPKVADCILLYGYGFKEAFPSDVWIKRIISQLYFKGEEISPKKAREFGMNKFKTYGGYAQLYLFHYARKSGLMDKLKQKK